MLSGALPSTAINMNHLSYDIGKYSLALSYFAYSISRPSFSEGILNKMTYTEHTNYMENIRLLPNDMVISINASATDELLPSTAAPHTATSVGVPHHIQQPIQPVMQPLAFVILTEGMEKGRMGKNIKLQKNVNE